MKPDTKLHAIQTIRVPREVDDFARREAWEEAERTGRRVTKADVLRDLMREGMRWRLDRVDVDATRQPE